jgi:outer membrane murein-binding lipoprotein Lpp
VSLRRLLVLSTAVVVSAGLLSGCTSPVAMQPAPSANDPLCAEVSVRLPDTLDGKERRQTDAQATGAWGDPAAVLLTCGLEPPGPTTLPCSTVDGVDWIIEDLGDFRFRVTTFGRTPAVELYLDTNVDTGVSSAVVLESLASAVGRLPTDGACTDAPVP